MNPSPPYHIPDGPRRIVCLTEETTEILYGLGESERIVGISAYTVRPPEARRDKPVVSAFIGGSVSKICALQPDLVIGFSDVQAELARQLIAAHLPVLIFNQRSIQEILNTVISIGNLVGAQDRAHALVDGYVRGLTQARQRAQARPVRPRVYFEEWDDPSLCGIAWVSELIELAGGIDVFGDRARAPGARDRQVTTADIEAAAPDVIIASWCGKPFDRSAALRRLGNTPAGRTGRVHEMPPEIILQPGPACLTDGLRELERIIAAD